MDSVVDFWRGRGAALLLVIALALGGCGGKKSDPSDAAKHFFSLLAAGDPAAAYAESAFGFQAQQSQNAFLHNVTLLDLTHQTALAWEPPEVTADEARVKVEVTTGSDKKLTFLVTLVPEAKVWRVHSLLSPRGPGQPPENRFTLVGKGASFSAAQSQPLPSEEEIHRLAQTTMKRFDAAVLAKSFASFYETVAVAWRKQLTVGQLERAFGPFISAEVRISGLNEAELQLDGPPVISPEGILVVNGHFNTAPYQVYFNMKFLFEQPSWMLFGLDVRLQK